LKNVEDALFEHPAVAGGAIIGVPHPVWGETVIAVVVPKPGSALAIEEIREFMSTRIAEYKRPRLLEIVDRLPRNVSGKILKYQLRDKIQDGFQLKTASKVAFRFSGEKWEYLSVMTVVLWPWASPTDSIERPGVTLSSERVIDFYAKEAKTST
jgi:hypothetical protein